jgi:hypothetical protein
MYIRVHTPLRRLGSTNRPMAVLSVVDNELATQLVKQGKTQLNHEMERFQAVFLSQVWVTTVYLEAGLLLTVLIIVCVRTCMLLWCGQQNSASVAAARGGVIG